MAGENETGSAGTQDSGEEGTEFTGSSEKSVKDGTKATLYSAGEVCVMTGTTRKTLFYYDKIGLLTPTLRSGAQRVKQYDAEKVRLLRKILIYIKCGTGHFGNTGTSG